MDTKRYVVRCTKTIVGYVFVDAKDEDEAETFVENHFEDLDIPWDEDEPYFEVDFTYTREQE